MVYGGAISSYGGIGEVLQMLADTGFFEYVLPFLLVFSLVFGVLSQIRLFKENKGVNVIIALSVALLSLQFGFVSEFFSVIFPYTGIGLVIILVMLILTGLFVTQQEKWWFYTFFGISAAVFLIIVFNSLNEFYWWGSYGLQRYTGWIITALIVVGGVIAATAASKSNRDRGGETGTLMYVPPFSNQGISRN